MEPDETDLVNHALIAVACSGPGRGPTCVPYEVAAVLAAEVERLRTIEARARSARDGSSPDRHGVGSGELVRAIHVSARVILGEPLPTLPVQGGRDDTGYDT